MLGTYDRSLSESRVYVSFVTEQQLFVAEEARGHRRVWSQRNNRRKIIIFASIYKLSTCQATQAGY